MYRFSMSAMRANEKLSFNLFREKLLFSLDLTQTKRILIVFLFCNTPTNHIFNLVKPSKESKVPESYEFLLLLSR